MREYVLVFFLLQPDVIQVLITSEVHVHSVIAQEDVDAVFPDSNYTRILTVLLYLGFSRDQVSIDRAPIIPPKVS